MAEKKTLTQRGGSSMDFDALSWMTAHESEVMEHCGQWVALRLPDGIVASGPTLDAVVSQWRRMYPGDTPFVFMVPEHEGAFVP